VDNNELVARRPPWWWSALPGALALACYFTLESRRFDVWQLYYVQFALVLLGLGMACPMSNIHPAARTFWVLAYLGASVPTGFFVLLDALCRWGNNCI
jgi:hypothetical protein